jgi:hypothetical protein
MFFQMSQNRPFVELNCWSSRAFIVTATKTKGEKMNKFCRSSGLVVLGGGGGGCAAVGVFAAAGNGLELVVLVGVLNGGKR